MEKYKGYEGLKVSSQNIKSSQKYIWKKKIEIKP